MAHLEVNSTPLVRHCDLSVSSGSSLKNKQRLGIPWNIKSNQYEWNSYVYK